MANRLARVREGALTRVLVTAMGALALAGLQAHAADSLAPLTISAFHGDVQVSSLGTPVKATVGMTLNLPASVRTGADGSIELRQGETIVSAAPNAQLDIPVSVDPAAMLDRIIQSRGNVYYSIAKRTSSKLHVETRYLVAVIKGTQFNVSVSETASTLSLLEGLVELRSANGSDVMNISTGQIGTISADQPRIRVLSMTSGETIRAGVAVPVTDRFARGSGTEVVSNTGTDAKQATTGSVLGVGSPLRATSSSTSGASVLASNVASANPGVATSVAASDTVGALQSLTARASSNAGGNSGSSNAGGNSGNSNAGGNSGSSNAGGNSGSSNAGGNSGNSNAGGNSGNSNAGGNSGNSGNSNGGGNSNSNSINDVVENLKNLVNNAKGHGKGH